MLNLDNCNFKTREEVKELAPSIFTQSNAKGVSDKYTHISTDVIIDDMETLGWLVVDAKEVKARKEATKGFQKHLIVFRNPDIMIKGEDGDDVFPQVLLTNSHDGKNAFTFTAGLFRMVCENGLVISTNEFEKLKIRHMGYEFETLQKGIREMVEKLPLTVESMNKMINTELTHEQTLEFAKECLEARYTEAELRRIKVDLVKLTTPVRNEDVGDNLWKVFNVVQEKILEGDFEYVAGSKSRKARKVKNFKQDMDINTKLFEVALNYVS